MLGQDLMALLALRHQPIPLRRADADLTDSDAVVRALEARRPEAVVHTAAYTAVDDCESHPEIAYRVNGEGTRHLALACRRLQIPMVYISTDYVFDGEKADPYVETDEPNPLNVYGWSKLQGERSVQELLRQFWIVRVSWLFGPLGKNFVRTIMEQARSGRSLRVVTDQMGAPTYTMDLAARLEAILTEPAAPGVYHLSNGGYCSWFEFAREIVAQSGLGETSITPIPASVLQRPARRPKNSRLGTIRNLAIGPPPSWQDALTRYLVRERQAGTRGTQSQCSYQ